MKINPYVLGNLYRAGQVGGTSRAASAQKQQGQATPKMDTITISRQASDSRFVQELSARLAKQITQPEDQEQIASLRQAVSEGSYRVSAEETADAILSRLLF